MYVGVAKAEAEGRVRDIHDVHSGDHLSQIPRAGRWSLELHPGLQTLSSYARAWTPSHSQVLFEIIQNSAAVLETSLRTEVPPAIVLLKGDIVDQV